MSLCFFALWHTVLEKKKKKAAQRWVCVCTTSKLNTVILNGQNPHQLSQPCLSCKESFLSCFRRFLSAFWRGLNTLWQTRRRCGPWLFCVGLFIRVGWRGTVRSPHGPKSRGIWVNLRYHSTVFNGHRLSLFTRPFNSLSALPRLIPWTERLPPFVFISILANRPPLPEPVGNCCNC